MIKRAMVAAFSMALAITVSFSANAGTITKYYTVPNHVACHMASFNFKQETGRDGVCEVIHWGRFGNGYAYVKVTG